MCSFRVVDSVCLQGHHSKANEDRCGWTGASAFVVDGATGLGNGFLDSDQGSDAAWLAEHARQELASDDADKRPAADLVRRINHKTAEQVARHSAPQPPERWNLPVASFLLVRLEQDALTCHGLGDCVLFLTTADAEPLRHSPMPDNHEDEMAGARAAIRQNGGLQPGVSLSDGGTEQARQRAIRARFNTAGGPLWTLGTSPEAAEHIDTAFIHDGGAARGIVCTDGFAALVDRYRRYSIAGLVETAFAKGLEALGDELRAIENIEDPEGRLYPRMKRSDDATAVLFEIT
ncbi:MAG: hypothetical protein JJ920_05175 [Roseitalea sp.]|jgi:hypothetical protein|nr:hypothetical protein [Roseitalea sp.]MBO6721235.1 hypothetical protein [Roseitalea sp.]MBO6742281.1 hypothetical protein [Roseitalea sp.]